MTEIVVISSMAIIVALVFILLYPQIFTVFSSHIFPQTFFPQIFYWARIDTAFFKKTRLGSALILFTALRDYGLLAQVHGLVTFFNISSIFQYFNLSIFQAVSIL